MYEAGTATVLITGANRGLGLEFAGQYAGDGWRVIAACRHPESADALRKLGAGTEVHQLDVASSAAIESLASKLSDETIDVMISNAGVMPGSPQAQPSEIAESAWLEAFRINTVAPLMLASSFLRQVARSQQKKMLVMSSWVGSTTANRNPRHYVYRASKSALNAVWRAFAIDHPEIIAVALSPGALRTDMTRYDSVRWEQLPRPHENISKLRSIIDQLTPGDSGSFIHFNGERLPW